MKTVVTLNFEHHTPIFTGFRHTLCCFIKKMQNWKDYCQQKQTNTGYFKQKHTMHKFNASAPIHHLHLDVMAHSVTKGNQGVDYTIKMSSVFSVTEKWKKILAICSIKQDTLCILHILTFNGSFKWMQLVFTSGLRNHQLAFLQLLFSYIISSEFCIRFPTMI